MKRKQVLGVVCLLSLLFAGGLAAQEEAIADLSDSAVPVADSTATASPAINGASVLRLGRFSGTTGSVQGQPMSGMAGITFALYADQEGGSPLWLETYNVELDH
jgi:hypothetical protein